MTLSFYGERLRTCVGASMVSVYGQYAGWWCFHRRQRMCVKDRKNDKLLCASGYKTTYTYTYIYTYTSASARIRRQSNNWIWRWSVSDGQADLRKIGGIAYGLKHEIKQKKSSGAAMEPKIVSRLNDSYSMICIFKNYISYLSIYIYILYYI